VARKEVARAMELNQYGTKKHKREETNVAGQTKKVDDDG
jgi:hypothetical protein